MQTTTINKLYLFDMDGTLLDSMPVWKHLGRNYLTGHNISPPDTLEQTIDSMTLEESAAFFQHLGLQKEKDDIIRELCQNIADNYRLSIKAKPGMPDLLYRLHTQHATLCLVTTSTRICAEAALKRLNLLSYFHKIYTSEELGLGKNTPEIYQTVCALEGFAPTDTVVYEDSLYAVRSAKAAGCHVVAVYDSCSREHWSAICSTADEWIK